MGGQRQPTSQRVAGASALRRGCVALTAVIAMCLGVRVACTQDATPSVTIDVGDCVNLKSPGERLDCYERHVEAARQGTGATPSSTPTPAPATAAAAGASAASAPEAIAPSTQAPPAKRPSHDPPPDIVATVTELHETVPNAWLITLDNGQVWRQNIAQRFALKPGHHVTLRGTTWGTAYRLSAQELHGFIQVERVR